MISSPGFKEGPERVVNQSLLLGLRVTIFPDATEAERASIVESILIGMMISREVNYLAWR